MMRGGWLLPAVVAALGATALPAQPSVTAEAMTDYRVHGLSWSGGRPTIAAGAGLTLPGGLYGDGWIAAARDDRRHGGADAAGDLTLGYRLGFGGVAVDASAIAHVFPGGAGSQDYGEGRIAAEATLGPVSATAAASYAPRQDAIGGDLLHLRLGLRAGVIGTPYTLRAQLGQTSGNTRDPARAARLRPDSRYRDWLIGVDRIMGPLTVGLAYSDTDIGGAAAPAAFRRHTGAVVLARAAVGF